MLIIPSGKHPAKSIRVKALADSCIVHIYLYGLRRICMDHSFKRRIGTFLFILCFASVGLVPMTRAAEPVAQQGLVDKSRVTFLKFLKNPDMEWFRDNYHTAKGLLIVPSLIKGAFFLGGSGGSGVLVVRDPEKGWSQPAFYTLGSMTFGIQFGGEASSVIMMLRTQKAIDKVLGSSFKLGGDTSIAAGPIGMGVKSNVVADIFSFTSTKGGAFAGVSLEGAVVAVRNKWNKAFFGKAVKPRDILINRTVSSSGADSLITSLNNSEKKK